MTFVIGSACFTCVFIIVMRTDCFKKEIVIHGISFNKILSSGSKNNNEVAVRPTQIMRVATSKNPGKKVSKANKSRTLLR